MKWTLATWLFVVTSPWSSGSVEIEDDSKIEIIEDVFPQAHMETGNNGTTESVTHNGTTESVTYNVPVNQYEEYVPLDVQSGEYPFYDENPTTEKLRRRPGKKVKSPRDSAGRTRYQRKKAHKKMMERRKEIEKLVKKALKTSPQTPFDGYGDPFINKK
uniref:BZIP domain-containing protein n=1 Tax=Clastoptera arizonana TaxID=38151 RepID=A0A1B6DM09_9HEMI